MIRIDASFACIIGNIFLHENFENKNIVKMAKIGTVGYTGNLVTPNNREGVNGKICSTTLLYRDL